MLRKEAASFRLRRTTMRFRRGRACAFWLGMGCVALLGLATASCGKVSTSGTPPPLPQGQSEEPNGSSADCDNKVIDDLEKDDLWDNEHRGNWLVKYGFKPMAEALGRADRPALLRILAADFSGQTLSNPRVLQMGSGTVKAERLEDSGSPPASLTGEAF